MRHCSLHRVGKFLCQFIYRGLLEEVGHERKLSDSLVNEDSCDVWWDIWMTWGGGGETRHEKPQLAAGSAQVWGMMQCGLCPNTVAAQHFGWGDGSCLSARLSSSGAALIQHGQGTAGQPRPELALCTILHQPVQTSSDLLLLVCLSADTDKAPGPV